MTTKIFDGNGAVSLGSISSEKDLIDKERININPPPDDFCCDSCGRHISELTPFGKAGDPLVGDFDGELLVKKFRRMRPYDEKAEEALEHVEDIMEKEGQANDCPLEWLKKIYGEKLGDRYSLFVDAHRQADSSWECRDCAVLEGDGYFEKLEKTYSD